MAALKGLPNGLPSVFAMGLPNISAKHQNNAFESLGIKKKECDDNNDKTNDAIKR